MTTPASDALAEESHPAFSPRSILRTLWKRRYWIAAVWLIITAFAASIVRRLPAVYVAEAVILVDSQAILEKFVSATVASVPERIATIQQEILSSGNLLPIIDYFGLYREQRSSVSAESVLGLMRKNVSITADRLDDGGGLRQPIAFRIGYQGPDPRLVTQVANRLASFYVEQDRKMRSGKAEGTSEFLEEQLQQSKKALELLEVEISSYKLRHNGELPEQHDSLASTLSRLQIQFESIRDAINRAQQTKVMLSNSLNLAEASLAGQLRSGQVGPRLASNGEPTQLQKRIDDLQAQFDALRTKYRESHPVVMQVRAELTNLRRTEAAERERANAADSPDRPNQERSTHPVADSPEVSRARQQVAALQAQIEATDRELSDRRAEQLRVLANTEKLQGQMEQMPVREQEMAKITRDYQIAREQYKSLLEKKVSADMALEMEKRQKSDRLVVLDPARVPDKPIKPKRPLLYAAGAVFGLVMGLLAAFGLEMHADVFLGEWELPDETPVLARLPQFEIPFSDRTLTHRD